LKVQVHLYASLSGYLPEKAGPNHALMEIGTGATVGDLLNELEVPAAEVKLIFLNGIHAGMDAPLKEGDRIGVFPAVGGG